MNLCRLCSNKKISFYYKIDNYSYYFCHHCQTLFLNPQPTKIIIDHYYKTSFEYISGHINKTRIINQAKKIIKNLKKLHLQGKTLLDIGCGYGFFLQEAKKAGFQTEGIEPSNKLTSQILSPLKSKVINLPLEEYFYQNKRKKNFDFIVMIHVIEHIKNPNQWIQMAYFLLNQNGILYIETPNLQSHLYNVERENYTFLTPPDHLWVFSKKSFQTIIQKIHDLKIEKVSTYSYPEHLMGIIKKLLIKKDSSHQKINNQQNKLTKTQSIKPMIYNILKKFDLKYYLFDQTLAVFFTPLLNINNSGSILELYIRKK